MTSIGGGSLGHKSLELRETREPQPVVREKAPEVQGGLLPAVWPFRALRRRPPGAAQAALRRRRANRFHGGEDPRAPTAPQRSGPRFRPRGRQWSASVSAPPSQLQLLPAVSGTPPSCSLFLAPTWATWSCCCLGRLTCWCGDCAASSCARWAPKGEAAGSRSGVLESGSMGLTLGGKGPQV